jgi:hypothetical protein
MMKTQQQKKKIAIEKHEFRSVDEFNKRFYPEPDEPEIPDSPDAEDIGEKLAKKSLQRLQAALASR